jgi:hypothetical protein
LFCVLQRLPLRYSCSCQPAFPERFPCCFVSLLVSGNVRGGWFHFWTLRESVRCSVPQAGDEASRGSAKSA